MDHITLDSYRYEDPQPIPASTGIRILQSDGKWHPVSTDNGKASIKPLPRLSAAELPIPMAHAPSA